MSAMPKADAWGARGAKPLAAAPRAARAGGSRQRPKAASEPSRGMGVWGRSPQKRS
jgi:hypothetical protein